MQNVDINGYPIHKDLNSTTYVEFCLHSYTNTRRQYYLAGSKRAIAICNRYEAFQMNSLTYNFDPTYMYLS